MSAHVQLALNSRQKVAWYTFFWWVWLIQNFGVYHLHGCDSETCCPNYAGVISCDIIVWSVQGLIETTKAY